MCKKAYIVKAYGGDWEDSWQEDYAVCLTRETAEKKLEECKDTFTPSITNEEWENLVDEELCYEDKLSLANRDFEGFETFTDGILDMKAEDPDFKYTKEELLKAESIYSDHVNKYTYSEIVEVDLFE